MPEKNKGGRPRKLKDGSIAFNVRLDPHVWAALRSRASAGGVAMGDLARTALSEWLLACEMGQRPIAKGIVTRPAGSRAQEGGAD